MKDVLNIIHFPASIFSLTRPLTEMIFYVINPLPANFPILQPLKTPENKRFSGVLREYKMGKLGSRISSYFTEF